MKYIPEQQYKSIFKTYMIYFICMVCFCGVRIMASYGLFSFGGSRWSDVVYTLIIQAGILFVLPLTLYCALVKVKPRSVFKTCNYNRLTWQILVISVVMGILVFLINIIVSTFFTGVIRFTGYQTPIVFSSGATQEMNIANFIVDVLLIAVLPALCEEFLHRGILLQGTKHSGFVKAIIISGILFGLLHFNINQVFYATILGIIMGYISVVSKNIWPAIIIHFVNNFISVYLDYAGANNWPLGGFYDYITNLFGGMSMVVTMIIVAVVLVNIVLILVWLITLLYKQSILRNVNKAIQRAYNSTDYDVQNSPIVMDRNKMIREMLVTNTMLNLDYEEMANPLEVVMPKQKEIYKPSFGDKIFLIGSLVLGAVVTLFTFVWGFI